MRRLSDAENGQKIGGPSGRAGRVPNAASFVSHIFQYAPSSFLAFGSLPTRQNGILANPVSLSGLVRNFGDVFIYAHFFMDLPHGCSFSMMSFRFSLVNFHRKGLEISS